MAQLTERDRGLLNNQIVDLQKNNTQLQDGIETDLRAVNNLTLFDIPYKKNLDEKHYNIYAFEEEWRLMTGRTIIGPVEEDAFWITSPEGDVTMQVKDGRLVVKKAQAEFVDVPIIPYRSYVVGSTCGPDFDIWTRDRYGSTSSEHGVPQTYILHSGNNHFSAKIDGITYNTVIIDDAIIQAQSTQQIVVDAFVLSSTITQTLNTISTLQNAQCVYNPARQTFTLVSGTVGPNSTAEVLIGSNNEIAYEMKFTNQTKVPGRYANNKLKVSIDGEVQTLELIFDIRIPIYSATLGYAWDDFSSDWRVDFSKGPLFPAQTNNGSTIASMIQNKLRDNKNGYAKAECFYYTDSRKFIVYSGTFGQSSSIEILPADDTLRDLAPSVGLNVITDTRKNEIAYTTLQDLYNFLNGSTNLQCTRIQNPSKNCYSLMSLLSNIDLSNQKFILQTTTEYDNASMGLPRLYSNKLTVNDTNDKIDLNDGSGEVTRYIPHDDYSESSLAQAIQDALNVGSVTYSVIYKQSLKVFIITASTTMGFHFNTGANVATSITTYIGFQNTSDLIGTSFTSNPVSFSGPDFFSMASIPQLVPVSYFGYLPPYYMDYQFGELVWLQMILIYLNAEDNAGTDILDLLENQADYNNEVYLNHWETVAAMELALNEDNLIDALKQEIAFYSRISTSDTNYTNKVTALNNCIANRDNLIFFLQQHAKIMNLRSSTKIFLEGSDFSESGTQSLEINISNPNDDRIYNVPAPEFRYADNKYIPMHNNSLWPLYRNQVYFDLFSQIAFNILSNKTGIPGFAVSGIDALGTFTITQSSDTAATLLSSVVEPYNLTLGTAIQVSIDSKAPQSATINANSASIIGTDVLSDSVFVITPSNDTIDYYDGFINHSVVITPGVYKGTALQLQLQTQLQTESPGLGFTVVWSASQFTISSSVSIQYNFLSGPNASVSIGKMIGFPIDVTGSSIVGSVRNIFVQTNINDSFIANINGSSSGTLTIAENNYSSIAIAAAIQTTINTALGVVTTATINLSKVQITTFRRGTSATIGLTIGVRDFLRSVFLDTAIPISGSGDVADLSNVYAVEVGNKISTISGLTGTAESGKVRVTTTSTVGQLSSIIFTSNTFSTTVGLILPATGVDQNNKLCVTIDTVDKVINLTTNTVPIAGSVVAADIQTQLRLGGTGGFTNATAFYDRFDYPNAFKIASGTVGPLSSVFVSARTILIDSSNNTIDFAESGTLVAIIAPGLYDGNSFATAIATALNNAGVSTYSVTFGSNKLTLTSDGVGGPFSLLFGTGANIATSSATLMGFVQVDKTSLLTYVSDAFVKLRQVRDELHYDAQLNVNGQDITDTKLTITNSDIISTVYWNSGQFDDFVYSFSTYPTISSLIAVLALEQPDYSVSLTSELWSRVAEQYAVFNNDQFKIKIGVNALQTITFNFTNGLSYSDNGNTYPFTLAGETLSLSLNGESVKTITIPFNTFNGPHTASIIQTLVRMINADSVVNQPAYTNFLCSYLNGIYYLSSGTAGTGSSVNVTSGVLKTKLRLNSVIAGTGDAVNNYFVSFNEIEAKLSALSDVTISNDNNFIKFSSVQKIEIIQTDLATRLGFYTDNLQADSITELTTVKNSSLQQITSVSVQSSSTAFIIASPPNTLIVTTSTILQVNDIVQVSSSFQLPTPLLSNTNYYVVFSNSGVIEISDTIGGSPIMCADSGFGTHTVTKMPYSVKRGYENRGDITVTFDITDDSLINSRRAVVITRRNTIAARQAQIPLRVTQIQAALTQSLYLDRWSEVQKRLNKKSGPYYAVGQKMLGIVRSQQKIAENNNTISEIQTMLS